MWGGERTGDGIGVGRWSVCRSLGGSVGDAGRLTVAVIGRALGAPEGGAVKSVPPVLSRVVPGLSGRLLGVPEGGAGQSVLEVRPQWAIEAQLGVYSEPVSRDGMDPVLRDGMVSGLGGARVAGAAAGGAGVRAGEILSGLGRAVGAGAAWVWAAGAEPVGGLRVPVELSDPLRARRAGIAAGRQYGVESVAGGFRGAGLVVS